MAKTLLQPSNCLQTNPQLVAWPLDDLTWFLLDSDGKAGLSFQLSDSALSVMSAFSRPRAIRDVLGDSLEEFRSVLGDFIDHGILLPASIEDEPLAPGTQTSGWSGFRFWDMQNVISHAQPALSPSRVHNLSGRHLKVFDGVLEQSWIQSVHRWFFQLPFRRIDVDTMSTLHSRHWVNSFSPVNRFVNSVAVFRLVVEIALSASPDRPAMLRRIDAYSATYGDLPLPHRDTGHEDGLTAVLYANVEWSGLWMGETVFYDTDEEATILVPPRPGRLIVFDSSLLHRAGAPSRECSESRYTLVFRFALS